MKLKDWLANGLKTNGLRTNDVLQKDEWKIFDAAIIQAAEATLVGIADLRSRGLVYDLGGLGVLTAEWQASTDMTAAQVDMSGAESGEEDTITFSTQGVPVPIIHKNYRINLRRLLASRKMGMALDTLEATRAGRKVGETMEDMLFNGVSVTGDTYTVYGYTNFPGRVQVTIKGNWDDVNGNMTRDVETLLAAADGIYHRGPFTLYLPTRFWTATRSQENTYAQTTYLERLKKYAEIVDIRWSTYLDYNEVVMVEMNKETVDLAVGQDVTNLMDTEKFGFVQRFMAFSAISPRLKKDSNGNSGVFHGTFTGTTPTPAP